MSSYQLVELVGDFLELSTPLVLIFSSQPHESNFTEDLIKLETYTSRTINTDMIMWP